MASSQPVSISPAQPVNDARPAEVRVLLAEDNSIAAELLAMMGKRLGAHIDWVENGLDAVDSVARADAAGTPYMMVLMDAMMPVMTGMEATRRIRAAGFTPDALPIVAVTAATATDEIREMMDAGMQAYLAKPVSIADLSACIDAWVIPSLPARRPAMPATFAALRRRFELRKDEVFELVAAAAANADRCGEDERTDLRNHLHKLAGTAGSFGEDALSRAAAEGAQMLASADSGNLATRLRDTDRLLRRTLQ